MNKRKISWPWKIVLGIFILAMIAGYLPPYLIPERNAAGYPRPPNYRKWGFIDKTGQFVIVPRFDKARDFGEGLAPVRVGSRWGYIDRSGKFIIKPRFADAYPFADGLAEVNVGGKPYGKGDIGGGNWFCIDRTGAKVSEGRRSREYKPSDGLAETYKDGRWGFVDLHGQWVVQPRYPQVLGFSEGLAAALISEFENYGVNYLWGFIDRSGEFAIDPIFHGAGSFSDGLAPVAVGDPYDVHPLIRAIYGGRPKEIQDAIAAIKDINNLDPRIAPLHLAVVIGRTEAVKLLLAAGASVNQKMHGYRSTPFELAQKRHDIGILKLIQTAAAAEARAPQPAAPLPLPVLSERTILQVREADALLGSGEMSVSPDGQHLLFLRRVCLQPVANDFTEKCQTVLLDTATGTETALPFAQFSATDSAVTGWMDNTFSAKGNYVHVCQIGKPPSDGSIGLYDVRAHAARPVEVDWCICAVSDEQETELWITAFKPGWPITSEEWWARRKAGASEESLKPVVEITAVPFDGGAAKHYPGEGKVMGMCREDRAPVLSIQSGYYDPRQLTIMNLGRGKKLKSFVLPFNCEDGIFPSPFWTVGDRFFCYNGLEHTDMSDAAIRRQVEIWDTEKDQMTTLRNTVAIAHGPGPDSILIVDGAPMGCLWLNLRVLDIASGKVWKPVSHGDDIVVCASGKYVVYATEGAGGTVSLVLVEIAAPTPTAE